MSSKGEIMSQGSAFVGIDMVSFFPDLEISIWDKEGEIKKHISQYAPSK
jgi:hypothetical protein